MRYTQAAQAIRNSMPPNDSKALLELRHGTRDFALAPLPAIEIQHAWFKVAGARAWNTLAIVPINDAVSGLPLAQGMGQMAGQWPGARVLVVDASIRGCQPGGRRGSPLDAPAELDDLGSILSEGLHGRFDFMDFSLLPADDAERALALGPQLLDYASGEGSRYSTVIMALDSPLSQTRSIPAARAADAVILCMGLHDTTFRECNEVIEMVGREHIIGSIIVKP
jgi:hypothetical protein